MPIHLPPIRRRDFLAGTLAAASGLVLPRRVFADEPRTDPNLWILMADIHVPEDRERVLDGIKAAKNLELAVEQIRGLSPRPAGAIVAGDCAILYGESGDYATLGELIEPLRRDGIPVHFALGNHDNRARFLAAFPEAEKQAAADPDALGKFVSVVETPHADWFLLDSLNPPDQTAGRMGEAELAWLARALDARPDRPALLVAHHNPDAERKNAGLFDTEAFFRTILPRKQVKAYFFGHQHCWSVRRDKELYLVNVPGNVWLFDKTQPRGFVAAQLQPGGATLELHALDGKHPKHGEKIALQWRK